jgi:hypothetical protein
LSISPFSGVQRATGGVHAVRAVPRVSKGI